MGQLGQIIFLRLQAKIDKIQTSLAKRSVKKIDERQPKQKVELKDETIENMAEEVELDPKIQGIYPEEARERLNIMGYEENAWDRIMKSGTIGLFLGSHEVRALISIARGTKPRLLDVVYR